MSSFINNFHDAKGTRVLLLRGEWSAQMDAAVGADDWERLCLHGVDWQDFTPLLRHRDRVKWLSVPLGPDSHVGLEDLQALVRLNLRDSIGVAHDFRRFEKLTELEFSWGAKNKPEHINVPCLRRLVIYSLGLRDLTSFPVLPHLTDLQLHGGKVKSFRGINNFPSLKALHFSRLRGVDLSDVNGIPGLSVTED